MSMRYPAGFISAFYNPLKNPDAPTIGTATAGISSLSVTFTAPANVGGSAITSYLATAKKTSDGTLFTASGASSPITVTGLTADAFTATVVAVNSYGPSASSAASNSVTPLVIGGAFGGGFFAGQISTAGNSIADYNLVVGPKSTAQSSLSFKNANTTAPGTTSLIDGPANTAAMVADGNATVYPCAHFCNDLSTGGQTDWYMPARNELDVCYFNLKPTTGANSASGGVNANAVPARASSYTSGTPAQTSATDFQSGGTEAFDPNNYWSSNDAGYASAAMYQRFPTGGLDNFPKVNVQRVRAVRRVAV